MGTFTENGWLPPEEPMPEEDWLAALHQISEQHNRHQWQLGDLWAYGDRTYGNRKALTEAPDWRGPSFQTCAHAATTARAFKETCRRRQVLSFTHHAEVAALPGDVADEMLDWAQREGKSSRDLRARVVQWNQNPCALDIEHRAKDYLGKRTLCEATQKKLWRVVKVSPDLAVRVVAGELTIESAWLASRDRLKDREAALQASREEAMAQRRAALAPGQHSSVVVPIRRTLEEERQHARETAERLLNVADALRVLARANVSADGLLRVLTHEQRIGVAANLHMGMPFLRNVLNTLTIINRSEQDEHSSPATNSGS